MVDGTVDGEGRRAHSGAGVRDGKAVRDLDRAALSRPLEETQQSWLLGPEEQKKKKKYVDLGCIIVSRKIFVWTLGTLMVSSFLAGFITLIVKTVPRHHHSHVRADNYMLALHKALIFFNAQHSGKLPKHNNVSWRGNSCMDDGKSDSSMLMKDLVGGFYDAGDDIKFNLPASFAMNMLSWSVIEYSAKYEAAGELNHIKEIIKWGNDYFLKTFNHTADTIDRVVAQVCQGPSQFKESRSHLCCKGKMWLLKLGWELGKPWRTFFLCFTNYFLWILVQRPGLPRLRSFSLRPRNCVSRFTKKLCLSLSYVEFS